VVRINLVDPHKLADQHLVAEYDEILMLLGCVKKYPLPGGIPEKYCLGKGHVKFFKDKLAYLKRRFEEIKREMKRWGFKPRKTVSLKGFPAKLKNDWAPSKEDERVIHARLAWKIRSKPGFYTYFGKHEKPAFFEGLLH